MARLLFGVTGGIAAYKMLETARLAIQAGHSVRVIQTPSSGRFVGEASFAGITGAPVLCGEFDDDPLRGAYPGDPPPERAPISHLALVANADLYLIAPATANTLAGLAGGHADSLVSTAALAAACPVMVAPAMNDRMFLHPAVQENVRHLAERGVLVVGPGTGSLASHGEHGVGRMSEPAELLSAIHDRLAAVPPGGAGGAGGADREAGTGRASGAGGPWSGVRVLVTAGGTREPIDSVRYIGNRSSGRMGLALARQAAKRGATVTLIAANVALQAPAGVTVVAVGTAAELGDACAERFAGADVLLMAAAVADFRPRAPAVHKLKKDHGAPQIDTEPTEDVLMALSSQRRPEQVLVGFAAEHGAGAVAYAAGKLRRKGLDAIVVNDIAQAGIGFDASDNEVTMLLADGGNGADAGGRSVRLPRASKDEIAGRVLDEVETLRGRHTPAPKETDHRAPRADADRATRV